jgi:ABC-type molybdate transport system ATPase subunit
MNKIHAVVTSVDRMEIVTYITLKVGETDIKIMKSEAPKWLKVDDHVYFTFQEYSVCIGKACNGKVSIENRIPAVLTNVRKKHSLCELKLSSEIGDVVSLMTQSTFEELELEDESKAIILLREIDINLEPYIEPGLLESLTNSRTKVAC